MSKTGSQGEEEGRKERKKERGRERLTFTLCIKEQMLPTINAALLFTEGDLMVSPRLKKEKERALIKPPSRTSASGALTVGSG
jgi:hypothetical protein